VAEEGYCDAKHFQWLIEHKLREYSLRSAKIAKNVCFGSLVKAENPFLSLEFVQAYPEMQGIDVEEKYIFFSDKAQEQAIEKLELTKCVLENPNAIAYMKQLQLLVNKEKLRIDALVLEEQKPALECLELAFALRTMRSKLL
jgi:hypothetical protein